MKRPIGSHSRRVLFGLAICGAVLCAASPAAASVSRDEISWELRQELYAPVKEWIGKVRNEKNESGRSFKEGTYSRSPRKLDDSTFEVGVHVNTARDTSQLTERYTLKLVKDGAKWKVGEAKVVDTYVGLYREQGVDCAPFESFSFKREGLTLGAGNGTVCTTYLEGQPAGFVLQGAGMTYGYEPPEHAAAVSTGHDFYRVHKILAKDHSKDLQFTPAAFLVGCDPETCRELLSSSLRGAPAATGERKPMAFRDSGVPTWIRALTDRWAHQRESDAFAHFRRLPPEGKRYYDMWVLRDLDPFTTGPLEGFPGSGVILSYNNWDGWEVQFTVLPRVIGDPDQLIGTVYGYFTEQTLKDTDPYELERRDDEQRRWHEVQSVKGRVDLALETPDLLEADLEFGINLKRAVRELPFFIIAFAPGDILGRTRASSMFVNSIQLDGKELTWVKTGDTSGLVILPQEMPAGTLLKLRMNYSSQAIRQYTYSYSYVDRFGWMPFVDFGDFIDEFELTIRSPAKNDILGIGQRMEERVEGDVRISRWKADRPVVFPSIILGRYRKDTPGPKFALPKRADGKDIPIAVHIDEASFGEWDIRPDALRPIAEQAANAISLYTDISGLDYPYAELNLVNDPRGFLYGQAPSSLIYLGSGVFRGAGFLSEFFDNPGGISKFLKSVTAHEVGHQWWGSRVSNANNRNYWFVESLAEYFSAIYLEAVFGWKEYEEQVEEWRRAILQTNLKGSVQNASSLFSGEDGFRSYQASVYSKGPYMFHMLREMFRGEGPRGPDAGDKKFFMALKKFSQALAEKREIVTLDIQNALEEALGGVDQNGNAYKVDLDWFFDQWIRGTGTPQYRMEYDVRQAEGGAWIVEGVVQQRVLIGNNRDFDVVDGTVRGAVDLTIKIKGGKELRQRLIVEKASTPFRVTVPEKPLEVALNKNNATLAHDVKTNVAW